MNSITRRNFLRGASCTLAVSPTFRAGFSGELTKPIVASAIGQEFPPWKPGVLDIHHISTGRGSCAFLMCPDGTTMMIDAGSMVTELEPARVKYLIAPVPDASLRPGQRIGQYVQRCLAQADRKEIDCFVLTHLHPDHMGEIFPGNTAISPESRHGGYQLGGLTDVAEILPIKRILDRAYPTYNYPVPLNDPQQKNYRAFLESFAKRGGKIERFVPGSADQLKLQQHPNHYPTFSIRNLAVNGEVWTGVGEQTTKQFPELRNLKIEEYPTENKCSLAIRLSYGKFDYFSAGDMDHETHYGNLPWGDIESKVAQAAGPVEVAVANHHGWVDACGPDWVRSLQAKAYVINAWDSAHPTMTSLNNMLSTELYPGPRAVFSTAMKPENVIAVRRLSELKSQTGHVVFRVAPGGDSFEVFIRDNRNETMQIISTFGPYRCA